MVEETITANEYLVRIKILDRLPRRPAHSAAPFESISDTGFVTEFEQRIFYKK